MVRVLGIETATWTASVAIIEDGKSLAERTLQESANHGTALFPLVDEALIAANTSLEEIDLIAVSIGPGSFTGLRIGLSMAKGLALACGIPVVGVPTLKALAWAAGPRPHLLWTILDARKREVYAAAFDPRREMEEVVPAVVCTAEDVAARLVPPCTVVGNGIDAYAAIFRSRCGNGIELQAAADVPPSGAAVARLGLARFRACGPEEVSGLEPRYVRPSEAERARITSV